MPKVKKTVRLELTSYGRKELITFCTGTAHRGTWPFDGLGHTPYSTSLTHALMLYVQSPHSVTCSQANTKSFQKHLSFQKQNLISRTNPPKPVGAIARIRQHQDVKTGFTGKLQQKP